MRKILTFLFTMIFLFNSITYNLAATEPGILAEPIAFTYNSRSISEVTIQNISFKDLSSSHWAKEAATRLGALDVMKGYSDNTFKPDNTVSKQELLAAILRVIGMEDEALTAAETLTAGYPEDSSIFNNWARGYMQVAANQGLITQAELTEGLQTDQAALDPATSFVRTAPVSREQAAKWIVQAIAINNPNLLSPIYQAQAINSYNDVNQMGADFAPYIEAMVRGKYMVGNNNLFNPKGTLKRSEMAQIIKNLENVLYGTMGMTQKAGVIGAIVDEQGVGALSDTTTRKFYIRNESGTVELLTMEFKDKETLPDITKDTPVYRNGVVGGMMTLQEGDAIEYLVNGATSELLYIHDRGTKNGSNTGVLQPFTQNGMITIQDDQGTLFTYQMKSSLYDSTLGTVKIDGINYAVGKAPVSHPVKLTLSDNVVTAIELAGDAIVAFETSGLVKMNNPALSTITIIDWNGKEVTKKYKKGELIVEKQNYYDDEDEIGYLDEIFPDYEFDERDTTIDQIEPGDIVHMRMDPSNTAYVTMISAKTNYIVRYGTVQTINYKGAEGVNVTVVDGSGATSFYNVTGDIPVLKNNQNVNIATLVPGDIVKLLVNEAVIKPGEVTETVKEIVIDRYGNEIMNVYKGELGSINNNQQILSVNNIYTLGKTGWANFTTSKNFDISGNQIEYYNGDQQISLSYAQKYLKNPSVETYVATINVKGKEQIKKITFRSERDSVLAYTNVTYSNGLDSIKLMSQSVNIGVDPGTIVIKNGKLVQTGSIMAPDYAHVVLNGAASAAIVQIEEEPGNDGVTLFRGRVASIEDGQSFKLQSHAVLIGNEWVYSPIPRTFEITPDTKLYNEDGIIPMDEFIDYSDITKLDEVYTILAEGTKANLIVSNPYSVESVKGQIYKNESDSVMIKDVMVYTSADKKWSALSLTNSYAQVDLLTNSIILKNNKVIGPEDLEIGDTIRVMTPDKLITKLQTSNERTVKGYVVFVE